MALNVCQGSLCYIKASNMNGVLSFITGIAASIASDGWILAHVNVFLRAASNLNNFMVKFNAPARALRTSISVLLSV